MIRDLMKKKKKRIGFERRDSKERIYSQEISFWINERIEMRTTARSPEQKFDFSAEAAVPAAPGYSIKAFQYRCNYHRVPVADRPLSLHGWLRNRSPPYGRLSRRRPFVSPMPTVCQQSFLLPSVIGKSSLEFVEEHPLFAFPGSGNARSSEERFIGRG